METRTTTEQEHVRLSVCDRDLDTGLSEGTSVRSSKRANQRCVRTAKTVHLFRSDTDPQIVRNFWFQTDRTITRFFRSSLQLLYRVKLEESGTCCSGRVLTFRLGKIQQLRWFSYGAVDNSPCKQNGG